jgi:heme-degrading monooxygenase HmoA
MYVILWEFVVRPEKVEAFVAAYGSNGQWAQLFARADGYLGTELLSSADSSQQQVFITIDRWQTVGHFAQFEAQFDTQYRTLDTHLEELTLKERKLGAFVSKV